MYTAPRHPKSNGLAENFVKTIKSAISAVEIHDIIDLERAIHAFLFQYRNAVHKMTNQRPSVLFRQEILQHTIVRNANILFRRGNDSHLHKWNSCAESRQQDGKNIRYLG